MSRDDAQSILSSSFINHLWNKNSDLLSLCNGDHHWRRIYRENRLQQQHSFCEFSLHMLIWDPSECCNRKWHPSTTILVFYLKTKTFYVKDVIMSLFHNMELLSGKGDRTFKKNSSSCTKNSFEIWLQILCSHWSGSAPGDDASLLNELLIEVSLSFVWRTSTSVFILASFVSDKFPITSWWKYNYCVLQMGFSGIIALFNAVGGALSTSTGISCLRPFDVEWAFAYFCTEETFWFQKEDFFQIREYWTLTFTCVVHSLHHMQRSFHTFSFSWCNIDLGNSTTLLQ